MIGHSLGRMGICMEEHTCEAKLPLINGDVARNLFGLTSVITVHRDISVQLFRNLPQH